MDLHEPRESKDQKSIKIPQKANAEADQNWKESLFNAQNKQKKCQWWHGEVEESDVQQIAEHVEKNGGAHVFIRG